MGRRRRKKSGFINKGELQQKIDGAFCKVADVQAVEVPSPDAVKKYQSMIDFCAQLTEIKGMPPLATWQAQHIARLFGVPKSIATATTAFSSSHMAADEFEKSLRTSRDEMRREFCWTLFPQRETPLNRSRLYLICLGWHCGKCRDHARYDETTATVSACRHFAPLVAKLLDPLLGLPRIRRIVITHR